MIDSMAAMLELCADCIVFTRCWIWSGFLSVDDLWSFRSGRYLV
jgi:hypothetical protein